MSKKNEKANETEVFASKKVIAIAVVLVIVIIGILVLTNIRNDNDVITKVSRISKDKYDTIRCINNECNGIIVSTIKKGKSNYKVYDVYGKLVAKYSENSNSKKRYIPYDLTKNYLLVQKEVSKDSSKYYIFNKKGKKVYETKGKLISINENYILEEKKADIDYEYSILNKKGKKLYSKITEYELYANNKFIFVNKDNKKFILNSKLKTILNDYEVRNEIKDDNGKTLYLILKSSENEAYYYFSVEKSKILNDGFNSYSINKDKSLTVDRKENEKKMIYTINSNGKQKKVTEKKYASQYIKNIRKKIDSDKYYMYTISLKDENQDKIFVDNKEDNSFGLYDLKNDKYEKLYDYSNDNIYSTISELDSNDGKIYYQISCSTPICEEDKMYVYNFTDFKELFNLNGSSLVATYYTQYKNNYKVVKYSYKSEDSSYKGKYVLYDEKGNELLISGNQISVIDSTPIIIGEENNESAVIYSSTLKKVLNDDNSLATNFKIKNENYYKYSDSDKSYVVDSKGKEIYSVNKTYNLEYTNENIFAMSDNTIKIYNVLTKKTNTYKMKKNEDILDHSNSKIKPFGSVLFIKNDKSNYIKVIDSNANVMKQIKNTTIYKVETNKEHKKAFIFTTSKVNKKVKYGFYIGK